MRDLWDELEALRILEAQGNTRAVDDAIERGRALERVAQAAEAFEADMVNMYGAGMSSSASELDRALAALDGEGET